MESVYRNLYVGGDKEYEEKKDLKGWSILRCCKEGDGGHRSILGYTTQAAPKGDDYLSVRRGNTLALNMIDPHDPNFIPTAMVKKGVEFIKERLEAGDKVLVACNRGHSRGPTVAMLFLRSIGELPHYFVASERIFKTLYPPYDPNIGMRQYAKSHWADFSNDERDKD